MAVCNGHHSTPFIPEVPGIENFRGEIVHAHWYRTNASFTDKTVLVLGSGASAADIGQEIAQVATMIYHSTRGAAGNSFQLSQAPNACPIRSHSAIQRVHPSGAFEMMDGSILEGIQTLLLCTGYHYDFPFLDSERNKVQLEYKRVLGLFQHIFPFNSYHPDWNSSEELTRPSTLAFVGLPWKVAPFPLFDIQARSIAHAWRTNQLPSSSTILDSQTTEKLHAEAFSLPPHYLHMLGDRQWAYFRSLAGSDQVKEKLPLLELLFKATSSLREKNPHSYKQFELILSSDPSEIQWQPC